MDYSLSVSNRRHKVVCHMNDHFCVIVERKANCTNIILKDRRRNFSLPITTFGDICDLKLAVQFLDSFLRGNADDNTVSDA